MKLTLYFLRQLELRRKRREMARLKHDLWQTNDWMAQAKLQRDRIIEKMDQLEAEIVGPENPVDLIRRAGMA